MVFVRLQSDKVLSYQRMWKWYHHPPEEVFRTRFLSACQEAAMWDLNKLGQVCTTHQQKPTARPNSLLIHDVLPYVWLRIGIHFQNCNHVSFQRSPTVVAMIQWASPRTVKKVRKQPINYPEDLLWSFTSHWFQFKVLNSKSHFNKY